MALDIQPVALRKADGSVFYLGVVGAGATPSAPALAASAIANTVDVNLVGADVGLTITELPSGLPILGGTFDAGFFLGKPDRKYSTSSDASTTALDITDAPTTGYVRAVTDILVSVDTACEVFLYDDVTLFASAFLPASPGFVPIITRGIIYGSTDKQFKAKTRIAAELRVTTLSYSVLPG